MIEKLDIIKDTENMIKTDGLTTNIAKGSVINKINEIIDWINDVSALCVTNKQVTANLPNIDAGELAYLQKENSDLKDEVEKLQKQLERAKSHLNCIKNNYNNWTPDRDDQMRAHAANCLAEIKSFRRYSSDLASRIVSNEEMIDNLFSRVFALEKGKNKKVTIKGE